MDLSTRHSCLRLEIPGRRLEGEQQSDVIFVKGTWFDSHFDLSITNGLDTWLCNASEAEVRERATQWDQSVSEYIETAERYLGFQQPDSVYNFVDAGDGYKRLSWTFEKQGTKLEWRWKCLPSPDNKKTTMQILDFLMDANIRLSEEVVGKTQAFERMKLEAEKSLALSEKIYSEKAEFESAIYAKFVGVLNSKKAKLRELRDRLAKLETTSKSPPEGDESTDKTEDYDEGSDDEKIEEEPLETIPTTSKNVQPTRAKSRKRNTRN
ncbi:DNA repair protein XRCC4 isoform X1 [Telopea speciosissima]|uniref:DNA repair protein XRCC4 isoform X1 n=1 Tax=Telopea speciosissima TaxID=54955 RepID=UPI001CC4E4AC|nr:DNA repair protein XRCC4 isoform X1 [Telopea speciosissima]XP_043691157.1 DNA repair protein XRCC4 isoform X1 [Telopea speciosissima]